MSRYRVTVSFELDIKDQEHAKAVAADYMRRTAVEGEAQGGTFASSLPGSPEVVTHAMSQYHRTTASVVATQLLAWGITGHQSWVDIADLNIENEPLD